MSSAMPVAVFGREQVALLTQRGRAPVPPWPLEAEPTELSQ